MIKLQIPDFLIKSKESKKNLVLYISFFFGISTDYPGGQILIVHSLQHPHGQDVRVPSICAEPVQRLCNISWCIFLFFVPSQLSSPYFLYLSSSLPPTFCSLELLLPWSYYLSLYLTAPLSPAAFLGSYLSPSCVLVWCLGPVNVCS